MKALLSKVAGGPETLVMEDIPIPSPGPGQALVRIKACGVNFPDVLMLEDKYQYKPPRPFAPGSEFSGIVEAVGEGVTEVRPGERVLGSKPTGGMAELVDAQVGNLVRIPDAMPFDDAAAFMLTFGTSYHALKDRGRLKAGETLLVLGAAGGVGAAAIVLGKAMGARVIAAVSSQEKLDFCKRLGADDGLIYSRLPLDADGRKTLGAQFKAACGPAGADVILDIVGDAYAEPALRAIAWEGRYLVIGFAAGEIPRIPLNLPLLKGCEIVGVFYGEWKGRNPDLFRRNAEDLMRMYAEGKVGPFISERFPLARGGEALAHLGSRKALGKVVVTVD